MDGLLVVVLVPLLSFSAMPGLCSFLHVTHVPSNKCVPVPPASLEPIQSVDTGGRPGPGGEYTWKQQLCPMHAAKYA